VLANWRLNSLGNTARLLHGLYNYDEKPATFNGHYSTNDTHEFALQNSTTFRPIDTRPHAEVIDTGSCLHHDRGLHHDHDRPPRPYVRGRYTVLPRIVSPGDEAPPPMIMLSPPLIIPPLHQHTPQYTSVTCHETLTQLQCIDTDDDADSVPTTTLQCADDDDDADSVPATPMQIRRWRGDMPIRGSAGRWPLPSLVSDVSAQTHLCAEPPTPLVLLAVTSGGEKGESLFRDFSAQQKTQISRMPTNV